jgi:hypothetical protein
MLLAAFRWYACPSAELGPVVPRLQRQVASQIGEAMTKAIKKSSK